MMGFVLGVCIKTEKLEKGRVQIRSKRFCRRGLWEFGFFDPPGVEGERKRSCPNKVQKDSPTKKKRLLVTFFFLLFLLWCGEKKLGGCALNKKKNKETNKQKKSVWWP